MKGNECYCCGGELITGGDGRPDELRDDNTATCRLCGAVRQINQSTGNIIWVRQGRLVAAFDDERESYIAMAERNNIPVDRWPEKYRPGGK